MHMTVTERSNQHLDTQLDSHHRPVTLTRGFKCAEDEQFREEKAVIIKEISMLDGPSSEGQPADASRHVW